MRKIALCLVLVFGLALATYGTASAGLCVDLTDYCNDVFFTFTPIGPNIYALHGYEYGCGSDDRIVSGTMHVVGNTAYIGLNKSYGPSCGSGDFGCMGNDNIIIAVSAMTGKFLTNYNYNYDGGSHSGHGTGGNCTAAMCSGPPAAGQAAGADTSE